jgi:hypothetical protein
MKSKPKLKRPAPGTVLGALALIVAVAGNANALAGHSGLVRKGDIAKGAVTAKALAKGAVHPKALAKGAVTANALGAGAVTSAALGANSVTASAIAPDSVHGYALGPVNVHTTPIADLDTVPANPDWTDSTTEIAGCNTGERLLAGGVGFSNPGNRQVGILDSLPFSNSGVEGMAGEITSNSGGTAAATVQAICLK